MKGIVLVVLLSVLGCTHQSPSDKPYATMPLPCTVSVGADGQPRVYCSSAAVRIPRPW